MLETTHRAGDPLIVTPAPAARPVWVQGLLRVDHTAVDWEASARAAVVISIPIAIAVTTHLVVEGVFASIGCFNVLLLQFTDSANDRLRRSLWGVGLNTTAIALGTLVGTAGILEIPLIAIGLIVAHLVVRIPKSGSLLLVVSALFVIGVGLPGASANEAGVRALLVLLGGALGFAGLALHLGLLRLLHRDAPDAGSSGIARQISPLADSSGGPIAGWVHAAAVGVTAAGGFALAAWAGLARDYWIMLTVVVVLRARLGETFTFGAARMTGTVLGAALGAVVTLGLIAPPLQGILLVIFVFAAFVLGRVNSILYAVGLTAFVIVLLNLTYSGGVVLAETRVLDTAVGGVLAVVTATIFWFFQDWASGPRWQIPDR